MVSTKSKIMWRTMVLPVLGIVAFLIYLYVFQADMPGIIATIQRANPFLFFLAAILVFLDTFLYALAWRSLLNYLAVKLSVLKSYLYVWYGTFMDIIIPAESVSSEISRVYLVTREQGNEVSGKVVASLVAHRLINMGVVVATIVVGMGALLAERSVSSLIFNLSVLLVCATVFFLALLLVLSVKKEWTLKIINFGIGLIDFLSRKKLRLAKAREEVIKVAEMFHGSMKEFGRAPTVVTASVVLSSFSWLCNLVISYMVFSSLDFSVQWSIILVTQSIVSVVKSVPVGVPFEVGLPEITMTTIYTVLGVPFGISATVTILTRVLTVWLRFFIGFVTQQWLEVKAVKAPFSLNVPEKA